KRMAFGVDTPQTDEQSAAVLLDPNERASFLDELKASGYRISPDQHVLVSDLMAATVANGRVPAADELARLLGPLLCKSAKQQSEFPAKFKNWLETPRNRASRLTPTG